MDGTAFYDAWQVWLSKGQNPLTKLELLEEQDTDGWRVGILDYVTLNEYIFPSIAVHTNFEQAFAAVGRALDKHNKE